MSADYPRMMYGERGATRVVANAEDEKALGKEWSRKPSDEHRVGSAPVIPLLGSDAPLTERHIPIIVQAVVDALMHAVPKEGDTNG